MARRMRRRHEHGEDLVEADGVESHEAIGDHDVDDLGVDSVSEGRI